MQMHYQVVRAFDLTSLEDQVNKLLKAGYKLAGGVGVSSESGYFQAVYLEIIKNEN